MQLKQRVGLIEELREFRETASFLTIQRVIEFLAEQKHLLGHQPTQLGYKTFVRTAHAAHYRLATE